MGYLSTYEFSEVIDKQRVTLSEGIMKFIKEKESRILDAIEESMVTFYTQHEDMLELSIVFPDRVFCVKRFGEDIGDDMMTYYKDGKMRVHKLEFKFPDYNEGELA